MLPARKTKATCVVWLAEHSSLLKTSFSCRALSSRWARTPEEVLDQGSIGNLAPDDTPSQPEIGCSRYGREKARSREQVRRLRKMPGRLGSTLYFCVAFAESGAP